MGILCDMFNFVNVVIDGCVFDKIFGFIDYVKVQGDVEILVGGNYDKLEGYFIELMVIVISNFKFCMMEEEIFGLVLIIYVYLEDEFEVMLKLVDEILFYVLMGFIILCDCYVINLVIKMLENVVGNFYINDKLIGVVVGQQLFGGVCGFGMNDKVGVVMNLLCWVLVRMIKEMFVLLMDYKYLFFG